MNDHDRLRESLGAYVLDQLGGDEAVRVEAHLRDCAACRAEHELLVPLVEPLRGARAAALAGTEGLDEPDDPGTAAPAALHDRVQRTLAGEARRARRSRRLGLSIAAVSGAAATVAVVVGAQLVDSGPAQVDGPPLETVDRLEAAAGVDASAQLVDHTWGMEIKLDATGLDAGAAYRVAVIDTSGQRHPSGGLVGTGSQELACNMNSAVLRADAAAFTVREPSGEVVIRGALA